MITPCFLQNLDGESGNVGSHNSEIDTVYLQLPSQTPWLTQGKCRLHFSQLQSLPLLISHHVSASFPAARMGPALKAKSSSLSQPPIVNHQLLGWTVGELTFRWNRLRWPPMISLAQHCTNKCCTLHLARPKEAYFRPKKRIYSPRQFGISLDITRRS